MQIIPLADLELFIFALPMQLSSADNDINWQKLISPNSSPKFLVVLLLGVDLPRVLHFGGCETEIETVHQALDFLFRVYELH